MANTIEFALNFSRFQEEPHFRSFQFTHQPSHDAVPLNALRGFQPFPDIAHRPLKRNGRLPANQSAGDPRAPIVLSFRET
jgi:hypothetical protein